MIRKITFPAALLAAALGGASVAYAATGAGISTAPVNPQPSTMKPAAAAATKTTTPAMNPAVGTAGTGATATQATQPATKALAKPKIHYIAFSDRVNAKDIAAFGSSKLSLDRAISSAERELDGKAVAAAFRAAPGHPHYVVRVMKNDRVLSARIDAESGKVTTRGHGVPLRRLYAGERAEFMKIDHARMSLADAVAFARKDSGNNPIAASMERSEGTNAYDIAVVNKGKLEAVWVSPGNPTNLASR